MTKRIAVIPARGGSKRIPGKNIRPFLGQPMICWSIEAAQYAACFDQVIVSTDSEAIAEVALSAGADVPFVRPPELSNDFAGTIPVIAHAVNWLNEQGASPESVCCIYPTAPLIHCEDLREGLERLEAEVLDYVFTVTAYPSPIQRALTLDEQGAVGMFDPEMFHRRSQDLVPAYHDAGQFYWGTAKAWLAETPIFTAKSRALVLPRYRVQDIDTPDDWRRAELMAKALQELSHE